MSYGTTGVGSYYMLQGLGGMRRGRPLAAFGGYGSLGALFYDGGKAYWTVAPGGEIVSSIAQKVYGNASVWVQICAANPQGRDPQQPKGDCWYKPGTILELPLVPGYPDPASSAPKSGLPTAKEGTTIVTSSGKVATVGAGGKISSGGTSTAAMSMGTKIGIAVAALALVGGMALLAKKKKGESHAAPHSGVRPTTAYAANRRRRRRHGRR
jgi:hypothetical protein